MMESPAAQNECRRQLGSRRRRRKQFNGKIGVRQGVSRFAECPQRLCEVQMRNAAVMLSAPRRMCRQGIRKNLLAVLETRVKRLSGQKHKASRDCGELRRRPDCLELPGEQQRSLRVPSQTL